MLVLRRLLVLLGLAGAAGLICAAASAYWTDEGDGDGTAGTGVLLMPTSVAASATLNTNYVNVSWFGSTSDSNAPADGYVVLRVDEADQSVSPACGTSASAPVTGSSCTDTGVTDGDYHYLVTAHLGGWTAQSQPSNSVDVVNDTSLPTATAALSPTANGNGYNNTAPVTVTITAHAGYGISSITYQLDAASAVTASGSTASVVVTGEGSHTLTYSARDNNGSVSETKTQVVRIDTTAPAAPSAPVLVAASDTGSSTSDGITNKTAVTVTGTAEAASTVRVYDGTTQVGAGTTAADGTYTITLSTLSPGSHTLVAKATDLAGNLGPTSTSSTVVVDTTAPSAAAAPTLAAASDSGVSSSDRITNITLSTYTGTTEPGATVALYNSTTKSGSTTAAADGTFSVTATTAITSGTRSITVKVTDVAGNLGASSAATTVYVDTTVPAIAFTGITAATDSGRSSTDRVTNVPTPTTYGTVTANTATTPNTNNYLTVLDNATSSVGALTIGTSATWNIATGTLADGAHPITVRATDAAGNATTTAARTVTIDTVAPTAPGAPYLAGPSDTGRSNTDRITKAINPVVYGTNENNAFVQLYDAGTTLLGSYTATANQATSSVTSTTLTEGSHSLTETQTDLAGNLGPASTSTVITVDTTAPAVPSIPVLTASYDTGISASDGITRFTTLNYTGTNDLDAYVNLYDAGTASGNATVATSGTYSNNTAVLAQGSHTITAAATDAAGNVSAPSGSTAVTVDTTAPTVTVNQSSGQADPTTTPSVAYVTVFSEPIYTLTSAGVTLGGTAGASTSSITGSGASYTVTATGMTKSGTVTATVIAGRVTDAAGNYNAAATSTDNTVTYTDNVAPAAPSAPALAAASDSGTSSSDGITKVTTPIFTGTAEAGATVKLYDGSTLEGTGTATGGAWSITTSPALANGTHAITAVATDPSGNVGPASASTSVTIDTVAPTATVNQASGQADPTSTASIAFTATVSETIVGFAGSAVTLGGTAGATTTTASGTGPYALTVTGMVKSGTVIPSIAIGKIADVAGNTNTAASTSTDNTVTYTDNVAPSVSISSLTVAASRAATVAGVAGTTPGDTLLVTVVLCSVNAFPCAAGNTLATLSNVPVSAGDGSWTVTSSALASGAQVYARGTQADQTGNTGASSVYGPVFVP